MSSPEEPFAILKKLMTESITVVAFLFGKGELTAQLIGKVDAFDVESGDLHITALPAEEEGELRSWLSVVIDPSEPFRYEDQSEASDESRERLSQIFGDSLLGLNLMDGSALVLFFTL